jgi:hypothetical protein
MKKCYQEGLHENLFTKVTTVDDRETIIDSHLHATNSCNTLLINSCNMICY